MASREMSESMLMTASTDRLGLAVTSYDDSAHLNATAQLSTPVSPQRSPVSSHPLGVALGGMGGPPRMQRSRSSRVRPGTQSPRVSHKAYPFHTADTFTTTANVIQSSTNHGKDQSAAATGRGQRYSIDYTTLTEIDRMRASQQVDGWGKKDAWSSASGGGQSAPQTPLCKGRSTRRYRHSATRNSFRHNATTQPVNSNSNANNNLLNNNALTQQHAKQAVSPILSSRAPLTAVSSLTLTCGGTGGGGGAGGGTVGLSTLDPNQNHPNSPSSLSPISHLSHLGQPHRSVGRSQSVRTAKRPQTLENSTRFRQRIASMPGDRAAVGEDWEDPATGATAASNASSSNSVYGAEAQAATGEVEVRRLRNFAVTSKGVVNRGDSFRSKANRSASLHRNHASSLNRLNVPATRQRSASGGSYNCIATQSGSSPELHTDVSGVVAGRGRDLEVCPSLSQVIPTTALCASLSDGNRVMSQLEESARIVLDGIHGQSNPEISIETGLDDLHTEAEPVEDVICCEPTPTRRYRVLVVGAPEVGKTSLTRQFTTSEYICSYDSSMDEEHEKVVQIILNGEESELVFIEHKSSEALGNPVTAYQPDAYLVVFSVTSKSSFTAAKEFLQVIRKWDNMAARAIILVANKTDLVRLRAVSTSEGRSYASSEGIKFCETSAGIDHNVDELLGGLLHQIRLKQQQLIKRSVSQRSQSTSLKILPLLRTKTQSASGLRVPHDSEGNLHSKQPLRAKMFLRGILRKACGAFGTSHSGCDNLHVL